MNQTTFRLTFVDVIRAFAICMMLQGHFIDGLISDVYRDSSSLVYSTWEYFRGMTAPIFFTISGFIFMYLLAKEKQPNKVGWNHIRVQKGIKRGLTLIVTAYLLRVNIFNILFSEYPDNNFRLIDVLHCIGFALLFMISIYLFSYRKQKWVMPAILATFSLVSFLFYPIYQTITYSYMPNELANYFTQANGSVFTLFPWFGFSAFGAFMGVLFNLNKESSRIYTYAIAICILFGAALTFGSKPFFEYLYNTTGMYLAQVHIVDNYIFHRVGNVLFVFAFFMIFRNAITNKYIQTVGQNTLSIYIIHYIILYGSFFGIGLYRFLHNSLNPYFALFGAIYFIALVLYLSHKYNQNKEYFDKIKLWLSNEAKSMTKFIYKSIKIVVSFIKNKILFFLGVNKYRS